VAFFHDPATEGRRVVERHAEKSDKILSEEDFDAAVNEVKAEDVPACYKSRDDFRKNMTYEAYARDWNANNAKDAAVKDAALKEQLPYKVFLPSSKYIKAKPKSATDNAKIALRKALTPDQTMGNKVFSNRFRAQWRAGAKKACGLAWLELVKGLDDKENDNEVRVLLLLLLPVCGLGVFSPPRDPPPNPFTRRRRRRRRGRRRKTGRRRRRTGPGTGTRARRRKRRKQRRGWTRTCRPRSGK
jgi:hypothetical protein